MGVNEVARSYETSHQAFQVAKTVIAGGVDSPVRAASAVGTDPLFITRGDKSHIWDLDGNEYIDYVCSWGPLICGHSAPEVIEAVVKTAALGLSFGAPNELETALAREIIDAYDSVELVRLVNSGTEATMSALRLARGYTGCDLIVKFAGCYHGHSDGLLVSAGSGPLTFGVPSSAGVPRSITDNTLVAPYNDVEAIEALFDRYPDSIAAVIVEPIAGNMGVIDASPAFLQALRRLCDSHGSVLIFDEVMDGFRVAYKGAQSLYGIDADLTCLGKIIGGGLPLAAFGGKRSIMELLAPEGGVYQAGTLSGNPLACAAGLATLQLLKAPGTYERLEQTTLKLTEGIAQAAAEQNIALRINGTRGMFALFFTDRDVVDYDSATSSDGARFAAFYRLMRSKGIYIAPSPFEAWFVSTTLSDEDIRVTIDAAASAFRQLAAGDDGA